MNKIAEGKKYCSVSQLNVSRNNKILAYGVDTVSRRRYTIHFLNLETGAMLPDKIDNATGQVVWSDDNVTLFYVGKDFETLRSDKVFRHKLGLDPASDEMVYFEADETFSVGLDQTKSRKYILINSDQTLSTETRFIESSKPDGEFNVFEPRAKNHEYQVDHIGDRKSVV